MPPISDARKRANDNYLGKQDDIKVRVPKGMRELYQAHAKSQGESLNAFIKRAMDETMAHDQQQDQQQ